MATKQSMVHQSKCASHMQGNAFQQLLWPTRQVRERAQEALVFMAEKNDGHVKGQMVHNGKPTREWLSHKDTSSPTVKLGSSPFAAAIDAKEDRDVITADAPNTLIQTTLPKDEKGLS